ncbi:MAG TPA: hypothetical protein VD866_17675 [Urbifossiella sp.]|nr:hypothetical protein [Urbifossiella sp.]
MFALLGVVYVGGGFFSFPVWKSRDKWGIAVLLFPAHSVLFWYGTRAAADPVRFVVAPLVLLIGVTITAHSPGDTAIFAGIGTAVAFFAVLAAGNKPDRVL